MLQQEHCRLVPGLPLDILVAQTLGQLGYMIESTLDSELRLFGIHKRQPIISLISYVVVDEQNPAFAQPTNPIGPCFSKEEAVLLPDNPFYNEFTSTEGSSYSGHPSS